MGIVGDGRHIDTHFAADGVALPVRPEFVFEARGAARISARSSLMGLLVAADLGITGLELLDFALLLFGQFALARAYFSALVYGFGFA